MKKRKTYSKPRLDAKKVKLSFFYSSYKWDQNLGDLLAANWCCIYDCDTNAACNNCASWAC